MKLVLNMSYTLSMVATSVIICTAPLIGIFLGGYLAGQIDGLTKNIKQTYLLAFKLTIVGYVFNNVLTFITNAPVDLTIMWLGITFGNL